MVDLLAEHFGENLIHRPMQWLTPLKDDKEMGGQVQGESEEVGR